MPELGELPGPLKVTIPAERSLVSPVRLAASGVAAVAGCSSDEVADVKLIAGEVLLTLIEQGAGGALTVAFNHGRRAGREVVTVRGRTPAMRFDSEHPAVALSQAVLTHLCREHSIELDGGELRIDAVYVIPSKSPFAEGRRRVG